jgi:Flp pilus assembly protein TadD
VSILPVGLIPNHTERAGQPEKRAGLELPLADHVAFFWKEREREQRAEDDGRANENRVNAGAHIKQSDDLRDLMDDIWQTRNQTERDRADVDLRTTAELKQNDRNDGEAGDGVAIEILRPRIVEAIQVKLKERGQRPNADGSEDGAVSARKPARVFIHGEAILLPMQSGFNRSEVRAARALDGHKLARLYGRDRSKIEATEDNMKTRTILTLSILIAAFLVATPGANAKRRGGGGGDAEEHRKKGIELFDQKNYAGAIDEFNKAVQAAPGEPGAYRDRGTAYRAAARAAEAAADGPAAAARFDSAMADFSKMIELAPKDVTGYIERAQTEDLSRHYDTALADANKALELKPNDALATKFRGFAYIGLSQWDKAVADFTVAIQADPNDPQNYDRRAWANRNLKNFPAAIEDYTTVLQKNPNDEDALVKRGATYAAMLDYEKAVADYQAALKIKPDDYDTVQRMQYAQAQIAAKNAPPPTPTPTPGTSLFTPGKIFVGVIILVIIAAVVRLMTRGKAEPTSSTRIR